MLVVVSTGIACIEEPSRDCIRRDGVARFGVVLSDYQSTAIGLLSDTGHPLTECWIDSGSQAPGLVAALSGDVVLATDQPDGVLTVIDRFGTDVYSRVSLDAPTVLGQVRLQDPAVTGAFSANPHDAVAVSASSVWVSRFAANVDEDAVALGRGSDLLELDPTTFDRTGRRISFEAFTTSVTVPTDDGPIQKPAYPRPSRIVRVGSTLIVGLARMTLQFDGAGPGAVAVVHTATQTAALFSLPDGVANCGRVGPVPGRADAVVVGCTGFSNPFGDEVQLRAGAGLFMLQVDGNGVSVLHAWRPRDEPEAPLAVNEVVAIDERRALAVDSGGTGNDRAYVIDLATGTATLLFESDGAFAVGAGAVTDDGVLLVPDAEAGLRRFAPQNDEWTPLPTIPLDGEGAGLPPRSVQRLESL